ncbi:MAG: hypothetical protein LHW64_11915, partial [Candidatus Cloacimonetes bacterium]|nr:hypothetical protein [Candidatus Cloacimonadota bacterium]MDY0230788.1 hypothetical protein [Candidatus Cloacimonadaceae bacterium]
SKYIANPVSLNGNTIEYRSTVNTLEGNKEYRLEIGAGVLDFTGAPVAPTQLSFTTYSQVGISAVAYAKSDYTSNLADETVWPKLTSGTLDQTSPAPQQPVKFYVKLTSNGAIDETSIMIWDYTANQAIKGAASVSYSADTKAVTLTIPANLLAKGQTYAIYLAGKNGLPANTPTTLAATNNVYPFADITDNGKGNNNRMTDTYLFSFSTASNDTVAPKLSSVKYGTSIETATAFPDTLYNAKTAATSTKVYYTFDEKVTLKSGVPVTIYDVTGSAAWALKDDTALGVPATAADAAVGATTLTVNALDSFVVGNVYKSGTNYFVVTAKSAATGGGTITISQPLTADLAGGPTAVTTVPGLSVDVSTTGKVLTAITDFSEKRSRFPHNHRFPELTPHLKYRITLRVALDNYRLCQKI